VNIILFDPGELRRLDGEFMDKTSHGGTEAQRPQQRIKNSDNSSYYMGVLPRGDERAEHLLKVLHKKPGDSFAAGVLGGKLGSGIILAVNSGGLECSLTLDEEAPRRTPLRLGVGFPRPIQLRRLLRDCASLGLAAVDLISTELGEKSYRDTKLLDDGGAKAALIEGAVQARDTRLPEIAAYSSLAAWLGTIPRPPSGGILVAADNVEPRGSFSGIAMNGAALPDRNTSALSVLAVGSERGWSGGERALLEGAGFLRLSMGARALRTETACVAAAVLLMEKMGWLEYNGGIK